jgi:hypothetical protein
VRCWIEINPVNTDVEPPKVYEIDPKPVEKFELRLVIWDTQNIKMMDAEGTSDVYFRAFFDSAKDAKETDTHFRC